MYQFFFCLYHALLTGTWSTTLNPKIEAYINQTISALVNALGGEYSTIAGFTYLGEGMSAYGLFANILAIITMFGVCFGVLKLTKMVFSIFFGGR